MDVIRNPFYRYDRHRWSARGKRQPFTLTIVMIHNKMHAWGTYIRSVFFLVMLKHYYPHSYMKIAFRLMIVALMMTSNFYVNF